MPAEVKQVSVAAPAGLLSSLSPASLSSRLSSDWFLVVWILLRTFYFYPDTLLFLNVAAFHSVLFKSADTADTDLSTSFRRRRVRAPEPSRVM